MIVISDKFAKKMSKETKIGDMVVHTYSWSKLEKWLSDYEIIVLDLEIKGKVNKSMYDLWIDIQRQIMFGGVTIALTFNTIETGRRIKKPMLDVVSEYGNIYFNQTGTVEVGETNYDWFNPNSPFNMGLIEEKPGVGTNIELLSEVSPIKEYFKYVKKYHKTLNRIYLYSPYQDDKRYIIYNAGRLSESNLLPVDIIAVKRVTKEPVAWEVKYHYGHLIYLPQAESDPTKAVELLAKIGEWYYTQDKKEDEKLSPPPPWIQDFLSEQEKNLLNRIEEAKKNLEELNHQLKRFRRIDSLLYASGKALETAVETVFKDEWGCEVKRMPPGHTIDFKVTHPQAGVQLVIEVAGVKDKIRKGDKELTQVFTYYLNNKAPEEKIILLANTYRETRIDERPKENFTKEVIEIAEKNGFCLMTTWDLYRLWKDSLQSNLVDRILLSVYNTSGVYQYEQNYAQIFSSSGCEKLP